jgi:hypothetical protein
MARALRDGQVVWSFSRFTGRRGADGSIDWMWRPDRLAETITEPMLRSLAAKGQYGLVAQHLTWYGAGHVYSQSAVDALRLLAQWHYGKKQVLVARASRMFEYATAWRYVRYRVLRESQTTAIDIISIDDPVFPRGFGGARKGYADPADVDRLRGLTFYCGDPEGARILIMGAQIPDGDISRNPPDASGRGSISIRWFDPDCENYSK